MTTNQTEAPEIVVSHPPHLKADQSIAKIMWMVVGALLPAAAYAVYLYGLNALILMLASVAGAVCAEALYQLLLKKPVSVSDGSAFITGLLLAMNVPPEAPVWMVVIGAFFAIIIVKQLFGGLGFNIFNPALAARAFLLASWPVYMTTRWHKFSATNVLAGDISNITGMPEKAFDAVTSATPLGALKEAPRLLAEMNVPVDSLHDLLFSNGMLKSLFVGNIGGCIGETSALLLLVGGLFLLFKKIITWHIPVSYLGTVAVFMLLYYTLTGFPAPTRASLFHLLSGGLMLGAFFMATDLVTSPVTGKGMIIFGVGCGIIASVIRIWGGYPEGVSYSILVMNAVTPLIDRYVKPGVFGTSAMKA